jgi:HSP20 family molecular chaperone IbpA
MASQSGTETEIDPGGTDERSIGEQHVPVNVWLTDRSVVVVAPMPGVMAEDVEVELDQTHLTLRAACRTPADRDYVLHEWHYGPYERRLELPDGYQGSVVASLGNGQLAVRVAKTGTGEDQQHQSVRPTTAGHDDLD